MEQALQLELEIVDVAYGGAGIAKHEGKVYFIEDTLPGDHIEAEVTEDKGSFANAKVLRHLRVNPKRQTSPCPYSDACGGCQWLNASPADQLQWKASFIANAFQRTGKIELPANWQVLPSPAQAHYRNRILLRGTIDKKGKITVGFFKKSTREQIPVQSCYIAEEPLNAFIQAVTRLRLDVPPQTFRLEIQTLPYLRERQAAHLFATVHPVLTKGHRLQRLVAELQKLSTVFWAGLQEELRDAPIAPFEEDAGVLYHTSPAQFQQVNLSHNRTLRRFIREIVDGLPQIHSILDLFCGSGNLSLGLGAAGRQITGVEFGPQAIRIAQLSVAQQNLAGFNYLSKDAAKFLDQCVKDCRRFDLVIMDPPRAGLKECVSALLKLAPSHLIYVSCDPFTLARDLGQLKASYKIETVTGLDFFPQTYHVETVVHLVNNNL